MNEYHIKILIEKYMHKNSFVILCIKVQNQFILTMVLIVKIIIHLGEVEVTREHRLLGW